MSNNIKEYRAREGMTQAELAAKLNISQQAVARWENGATLPSAENLIRLSRLLNCAVTELIELSEEPESKTEGEGT